MLLSPSELRKQRHFMLSDASSQTGCGDVDSGKLPQARLSGYSEHELNQN